MRLDIPEGWESHELSHLARIETGGTPPISDRSLYGNDAPFASPADIGGQRWIVSTEKNLSLSGWKRVRRLPVGAILVVCIGSTIGKVAMAAVPMATNQQINAVIPTDQIDGGFLYYSLCLSSEEIKGQASEQAVPIINKSTFGRLRIVVPPLQEQQAIAAALSDADEVVAGLERVIAKKRLIKQGAMQDLLTARRRLPGFSGEWEVKRLGAALTVKHGRSQKEVEHPAGQYPILATGGQIGTATKFMWDKPSVLIGRKGTIDVPRFIDQPFWTVDTLFYTDIHNEYDAKFLFYAFLQIDWMSYNEASGVPSLNAKTIENIQVSIPIIAEQQAIAAVLSDMDVEIQTLEALLTKARAVKEGMMQNLLTGRVRLV